MPRGKANCFEIWPEEGNSEHVLEALMKAARKRKPIEFHHHDQRIMVYEQDIDSFAELDVYTASAFRVRDRAYPSIVDSAGVKPLLLPDNEGLGELMCVAIAPIAGRAAILCSPNGPTPSSLHSFFEEIRFPHKMRIEPILRTDMKERLERARFVQSMEFKIKDAPGAHNLQRAGAPVERAIELADSVGGVDISVTVSMGGREGSLATRVVKKCAEFLVDADAAHVKRLVLNASEAEDVKCQQLDLLNARVEFVLELAEDARGIDRADCKRQLIEILKEQLPGVEKRKF
jgi:hypothetical protein